MIGLLVYLGAIAFTSFAIERTDSSLFVFEEHWLPRRLVRYLVPWSELEWVALTRRNGTDENIATSGLPR
jgi:hypothetical protein